jgi:hypothetical protein
VLLVSLLQLLMLLPLLQLLMLSKLVPGPGMRIRGSCLRHRV